MTRRERVTMHLFALLTGGMLLFLSLCGWDNILKVDPLHAVLGWVALFLTNELVWSFRNGSGVREFLTNRPFPVMSTVLCFLTWALAPPVDFLGFFGLVPILALTSWLLPERHRMPDRDRAPGTVQAA